MKKNQSINFTELLIKTTSWCVLVIFLFGCAEEEPSLTSSFFKIYDDSDAELSYHPIDVIEINDGYIILSGTEREETDFEGVQLIKVDSEGAFDLEFPLTNYVAPVGDLYFNEGDSNSYFFAMEPNTLEATLISVDPRLNVIAETAIGGANYPLATSSTSSGSLLLLSYDPIDQNSELREISLDGTVTGTDVFSIGVGNEVLEDIIDHYLNANERPLPFFCGEYSAGNYYLNAFSNFSLSLVFTNLSGATGELQGQSIDAGIRNVMPLSGSDFAVAGYQFTDNYQLPSVTLTTSGGVTSSADLYPGNQAELKSYTPSDIISYTRNETTYTVFASETEGRQIILHFYDAASGEIAGIHYIGYLNPFTLASVKNTDDNGIIVVGSSFVAGRFERITINKLSEGEIADIVN